MIGIEVDIIFFVVVMLTFEVVGTSADSDGLSWMYCISKSSSSSR